MQQKQIQVGNKKLLALDMPKQAIKAEVDNGDLFYFTKDNDVAHWAYSKPNMKIIGFKNDITEEQWAEIVEKIQLYHHIVYENYMNQSLDATFKTAKESGLSLLQANGILFENPYPKPPNPPEYMAMPVPTEKYIRAYKLWNEAESKIFKNCLIIQVI